MYTSDVSQSNFSQTGVGSGEIWIFFIFISSKNFKHDFLKVHFSKFPLCSTDFHELCRISTCILQMSHSQISAKLMQTVPRYEFFSSLYLSKTLNVIFSNVHFSKFAIYTLVFQVLSSNMPCILLKHVDMGAHSPILWKTQNSFFRRR